jgi:uncharacterized protein DUF1329
MRWLAFVPMVLLLAPPPSEPARAAASAEAEELKAQLTPVGAERAGNKDATIPAWTGGYTSSSPGYRASQPRADPFAHEKPLFSISAANFRQFADKLPEGAKALFQRFRDYRMDVYPSHRSAALPAGVYDSIFRNATRAHAAPSGIAYGVEGAAGGIPFPIPRTGHEAVWNHLLAYWGPARELHLNTYVVTADGAVNLATSYREWADFPFYYPDATPQSFGGYYFKTLHIDDGPPAKVGEGYLTWQPIDTARYRFAAWHLLPGERRVRRGASLSYDIPDPDASGFQNLDEYYVFFGGPDRYDFKILGKREMFVPYNNNRLYRLSAREVLGPRHANPDDIRYELHRVWVIEGTLAPGQHHVAPRRRLYLDEDSWFALYSDSWDEKGNLWKFGEGTTYLMPDVPALILGSEFVYDFDLGGYVYSFSFDHDGYKITAPHPAKMFSPEWLASQAVR